MSSVPEKPLQAPGAKFPEIPLDRYRAHRPGQTMAEALETIKPRNIDDFADISGDYNPIHMSDEYAKSKKLRGRVAHGAYLIARISGLIYRWFPDATMVHSGGESTFPTSACVGDTIQLSIILKDQGRCRINVIARVSRFPDNEDEPKQIVYESSFTLVLPRH